MKSFLIILFSGFLVALTISSCRMEKRIYRSGYHVSWKKSHSCRSNNKYELRNMSEAEPKQLIPAESFKKSKSFFEEAKNVENKIDASTEDQLVPAKKEKINFHSVNLPSSTKQVKQVLKSIVSSKKNYRHALNPNSGNEISGFAVAGFVCSLLGFMLFLATGWPFLLGMLGVIFSSLGLAATGGKRTGRGFAIAGLVIGILDIVLFWLLVVLLLTLVSAFY